MGRNDVVGDFFLILSRQLTMLFSFHFQAAHSYVTQMFRAFAFGSKNCKRIFLDHNRSVVLLTANKHSEFHFYRTVAQQTTNDYRTTTFCRDR